MKIITKQSVLGNITFINYIPNQEHIAPTDGFITLKTQQAGLSQVVAIDLCIDNQWERFEQTSSRGGQWITFTIPVAKGEKWRAYLSDDSAGNTQLYFRPLS